MKTEAHTTRPCREGRKASLSISWGGIFLSTRNALLLKLVEKSWSDLEKGRYREYSVEDFLRRWKHRKIWNDFQNSVYFFWSNMNLSLFRILSCLLYNSLIFSGLFMLFIGLQIIKTFSVSKNVRVPSLSICKIYLIFYMLC